MKRQARCWICGTLFEAERGSLPKGARFTCEGCVQNGLRGEAGEPPSHAVLTRVLYERHSVPYLELSHLAIEDEVLRLVHEDFARHHSLIPVMLKLESESAGKSPRGGKKAPKRPDVKARPVALVIAMSDPANVFAIEAIRRRIGIPVQRVVSTWAEIAEAINEHYLNIALADEPAPE
jgi:hypothetical protein